MEYQIINRLNHYISDGLQYTLFDFRDIEKPIDLVSLPNKYKLNYYPNKKVKPGYFQLQNRRFLGNKYKLLNFINEIVNEKCDEIKIFCDLFAGTGVVGEYFNNRKIKIIANDILKSNYIPLKTFLGTSENISKQIEEKVTYLNRLETSEDNYFSSNFGGTYFTIENARKIGAIREKIEEIVTDQNEKAILLTSLIYAADKVANTVGHFDSYRKNLDTIQPLNLLLPDINLENNDNNEIYNEDANQLVKNFYCDVLYMDPPYNSRQYSDAYHLLENLVTWEKPILSGKAKKMNRSHIKSNYCLQSAPYYFSDLIKNANCKHILVSYNNTGKSKDGRSNARISDEEIINSLRMRGDVEIFECKYKAFTTGKSDTNGHTERIFYCGVK